MTTNKREWSENIKHSIFCAFSTEFGLTDLGGETIVGLFPPILGENQYIYKLGNIRMKPRIVISDNYIDNNA